MKKIVEGVLLNTETATLIARNSYSNSSDAFYFCEELYLTRKGRYFIYAEGGAASKYSVMCGSSSYSGSSNFKIINENKAKKFAAEFATYSEYVKFFGEVEEG